MSAAASFNPVFPVYMVAVEKNNDLKSCGYQGRSTVNNECTITY